MNVDVDAMSGEQRALWEALAAFTFDEAGVELPFTARLAQENGWAAGFARRVVDAYRRFLFLAVAAEHPVTPSDAVDQAWHLHMTYTRSYWDELCAGVLGRELHHEPTRGGPGEGAKFAEWYAATLESHRLFFGEPEAKIWPPAAERFGAGQRFVRVNAGERFIVSKRAVKFAGDALALAFIVIGAVGGGVLTVARFNNSGGGAGNAPGSAADLARVLMIGLGVIGAAWVLIRLGVKQGESSWSGCGSGCGDSGGCAGGCGGGCGGD